PCSYRSPSLRRRCRFDVERHTAGFLPPGSANKGFSKNADVRRARSLSASYRGSLLASSDLAKRAQGFEAFALCGDASSAPGKESCRLPVQLTSARRLATAD